MASLMPGSWSLSTSSYFAASGLPSSLVASQGGGRLLGQGRSNSQTLVVFSGARMAPHIRAVKAGHPSLDVGSSARAAISHPGGVGSGREQVGQGVLGRSCLAGGALGGWAPSPGLWSSSRPRISLGRLSA